MVERVFVRKFAFEEQYCSSDIFEEDVYVVKDYHVFRVDQ